MCSHFCERGEASQVGACRHHLRPQTFAIVAHIWPGNLLRYPHARLQAFLDDIQKATISASGPEHEFYVVADKSPRTVIPFATNVSTSSPSYRSGRETPWALCSESFLSGMPLCQSPFHLAIGKTSVGHIARVCVPFAAPSQGFPTFRHGKRYHERHHGELIVLHFMARLWACSRATYGTFVYVTATRQVQPYKRDRMPSASSPS